MALAKAIAAGDARLVQFGTNSTTQRDLLPALTNRLRDMLEQDAVAATVFERIGEDWMGHVTAADAVLDMPEIGLSIQFRNSTKAWNCRPRPQANNIAHAPQGGLIRDWSSMSRLPSGMPRDRKMSGLVTADLDKVVEDLRTKEVIDALGRC